MSDYKLTIESMTPTDYGDIWVAKILISTPNEMIDDLEVAHNITVKVRFSYPESGATGSLLEVAYDKAKDALSGVLNAMAAQGLNDFREQAKDRIKEANKPFEFTPPPEFKIPGL